MKNSSELIAKNVYSVNAYYTKKQNKTKELFFKCLKEKRSNDYFKTELHKIWGNIDHRFMDKQIDKLNYLKEQCDNRISEDIIINCFKSFNHDKEKINPSLILLLKIIVTPNYICRASPGRIKKEQDKSCS